jgi:hypothetical protein
MSRGHSGLTLAERSARSGVGDTSTAAAQPGPEGPGRLSRTSTGCPRHCWVSDLADAPGRWPGLVAEWARAADGGWTARVVYAVRDGGQVVLVESWVPAGHLQPADG